MKQSTALQEHETFQESLAAGCIGDLTSIIFMRSYALAVEVSESARLRLDVSHMGLVSGLLSRGGAVRHLNYVRVLKNARPPCLCERSA